MDKSEQMNILTDKYLCAFLGFAINRIGNIGEAEELSQEIAFRAVKAVSGEKIKENFDAYMWSIAHNTYKEWCRRKKNFSTDDDNFQNIIVDCFSPEDDFIEKEESENILHALSVLSDNYRKTLVCFYYDELSISETAEKLSLSESMVKFYLHAGKQKLKETYLMQDNKMSISPSDFSVYRRTYGRCSINVWSIFSRKLPAQIALVCYDKPRSVSDISLETGVPAVYVEDEIAILINNELLIKQKDKYRTNFCVIKKNTVKQIVSLFSEFYKWYVPHVIQKYNNNLGAIKSYGIFDFQVPDYRYAWLFANEVLYSGISTWSVYKNDYRRLADGALGYILAAETPYLQWVSSEDNLSFKNGNCIKVKNLSGVLGNIDRNKELCATNEKAQTLINIAAGNTGDCDKIIVAELIEQNYAIKQGDMIYSNVAVTGNEFNSLMNMINDELSDILEPKFNEISDSIVNIIKSTIPPHLSEYAEGYAKYLIRLYSEASFDEALYNAGFLTIPDFSDNVPVVCEIML